MANEKYLGIYLTDHFAGSQVGKELANRCLKSNRGTPLAAFLARFIDDLDKERDTLRSIMREVGTAPNPLKNAAGWVAERVGRLKLNGQLTGYSDLSRVIELEGLCLGVEGKLSLWRNLEQASMADPRLKVADYGDLQARAEKHRTELERFKLEAAAIAFGT